MMDADRMLGRDPIEILHVERPLVFELGVVVEKTLDPGAGRSGLGADTELSDDAVNGDKLDLVGIANEHVVEQSFAAAVVVGVDEAGDNGHLPGIVGLGLLADQALDIAVTAHREKASALDGEGFGPGHVGVDGVDLGVEDDEIGVLGFEVRVLRQRREPGAAGHAGDPEAHEVQEVSTVVAMVGHPQKSPIVISCCESS